MSFFLCPETTKNQKSKTTYKRHFCIVYQRDWRHATNEPASIQPLCVFAESRYLIKVYKLLKNRYSSSNSLSFATIQLGYCFISATLDNLKSLGQQSELTHSLLMFFMIICPTSRPANKPFIVFSITIKKMEYM